MCLTLLQRKLVMTNDPVLLCCQNPHFNRLRPFTTKARSHSAHAGHHYKRQVARNMSQTNKDNFQCQQVGLEEGELVKKWGGTEENRAWRKADQFWEEIDISSSGEHSYSNPLPGLDSPPQKKIKKLKKKSGSTQNLYQQQSWFRSECTLWSSAGKCSCMLQIQCRLTRLDPLIG